MKPVWPAALRALETDGSVLLEPADSLARWLAATESGEALCLLERAAPAGERWRVVVSDSGGGADAALLTVAEASLEAAWTRGFAVISLPGPDLWPPGLDRFGPGEPALFVPLPGVGSSTAALLSEDPGRSDADRERRALLLNLGAAALARARDVEELRVSQALLSRELRDLARIQQRLLPAENPSIRGLDVVAHLDGFGLVAGDYYDFDVLSRHFVDDPGSLAEDYWTLMIADATGHGAAAAVEIAMFDALLRAFPGPHDEGPSGALTFVNDHFFTRLGRSHLISAFGVLFDPTRDEILYCSAGHPPPLLLRAGGSGAVEWLEDGDDIPVGVLPDHHYIGARRRFGPDDVLVLYTDGVIEATGPGSGEFGRERLADAVAAAPRAPSEMLAAIRAAVARHEAGSPPRDDRTLLVARRCASTRGAGAG